VKPKTVDEILEASKGTLQDLLIIGHDKDNVFQMVSSLDNLKQFHWLINKAQIELNFYEKTADAQREREKDEQS